MIGDVLIDLYIIINVSRHENTIRKGPLRLYCPEAVLDDSDMSNDIWIYRNSVYFYWPDALPGANSS